MKTLKIALLSSCFIALGACQTSQVPYFGELYKPTPTQPAEQPPLQTQAAQPVYQAQQAQREPTNSEYLQQAVQVSSEQQVEKIVKATPRPLECYGFYKVQKGETLQSIAAKCQTTQQAIVNANAYSKNGVMEGDSIRIPFKTQSLTQPMTTAAIQSESTAQSSGLNVNQPPVAVAQIGKVERANNIIEESVDMNKLAVNAEPVNSIETPEVTHARIIKPMAPPPAPMQPVLGESAKVVKDIGQEVAAAATKTAVAVTPEVAPIMTPEPEFNQVTAPESENAATALINETLAVAPQVVQPMTQNVAQWRWPMQSKYAYLIVNDEHSSAKMIEIYGDKGAPVLAVQDGHVAFAGDGIREYGQMVMIKHADGKLTVYAHNKELKVKEGDQVKMGDIIALMGDTGLTHRPKLYFEARANGRKIDAVPFFEPLP